MAISQETSKWLDDLKKEGNLTDDAFNSIKASFDNPKADEFVKGSTLRQSDYSRQMDSVKQAQKAVEDAQRDFQTKQAEVNAYKGTLDTWKAGAESKFHKAVKDAEAADTKATAALNRLKAVAQANGLDETEVLKDLTIPVNPNLQNPNTPNMDTSKFLTADQLNEQVSRAARETAFVDATIYDLASEYRRLYGQEPPAGFAKSLVEGAIKSKMTLDEYATKEFKFVDKRTEASEAAIQARIKTAVDEASAKILSDQALSGGAHTGVPAGANSPIFKNENIMKPIAADHQGGGGVSAAIAAHAAGKYR